ncbi:hypothetical protein IGI42_002505 [Enterococcus sp. AZ109]
MENKLEIQLEKIEPSTYFSKDLLNNAILLNEHLARELSGLQECKVSRITSKVIDLASATAILSQLALTSLPDADTVIQNRVSH